MRIVKYAEMKTLPVGTVFYECQGGHLGQLDGPRVKDCESDIDLYYADVNPQLVMEGYYSSGSSEEYRKLDPVQRKDHLALNHSGQREGFFDEEMQYLVLDQADVAHLVKMLLGQATEHDAFCPIAGVKVWEGR